VNDSDAFPPPPPPESPPAEQAAPAVAPAPPVADRAPVAVAQAKRPFLERLGYGIRDYFFGEDPSFALAVVPLCFLSIFLFTRHPFKTNFIFDEQEALLANPYVRSIADKAPQFHWLDAFRRDFWGLPPDRSIGSYRPIPDLVWRALWGLGARAQSPFLHHWVNVLCHGMNGAWMTLIAFRLTRDRVTAWITGACFVACAVLTEAVSGVVGIADVLGALGALLALMTLALPLQWMPFALFAATLFGLFSKESALVIVPLVPFAALVTAHVVHPARPLRWVRMAVALLATAAAFVLYVEARRRLFPTTVPADLTVEANEHRSLAARVYAALLRWYAQPALPRDPLNNPLIDASAPYRIAAALRVYVRGLSQIVFPWTLSGDYSAPQEPIPSSLVFPESIAGALFVVVPVLASLVLGALSIGDARRRREAGVTDDPSDVRPAIAVALMWIVISYFPVSNIPVLLPTVRAERFWYFPALGTSLLLGIAFTRLRVWSIRMHAERVAIALFITFVGFQAFAARRHANDYTDDLSFWDATRRSVPRSAKAHLNYSVMQGARGNLEIRLASNRTALDLAPTWPMASVYLGDTLCRLHRAPEAWPFYRQGFDLAPNDVNLIALGIQCLWDERMLDAECPTRDSLSDLAEKYPGSWLDYLTRDTLDNGDQESHHGVDPKYRPRGYNEGPKD
jgi:hypothetical protein